MTRRTGGSVNVSLQDSSMFSAESYPQSSAEQMVFARGTRFTKEIKIKQIKIISLFDLPQWFVLISSVWISAVILINKVFLKRL